MERREVVLFRTKRDGPCGPRLKHHFPCAQSGGIRSKEVAVMRLHTTVTCAFLIIHGILGFAPLDKEVAQLGHQIVVVVEVLWFLNELRERH